MGPLAEIALDLGYQVSGSDLVDSASIETLRERGATITIGQKRDQIDKIHQQSPIDWYVYSSAMPRQVPIPPELTYVKEQGIKSSKRDQFLVQVISQQKFKLLAVTGTHGKTTTTAMSAWLLMQLGLDVSYAIGGQFHDMPAARASADSQWFVYEADEYDHNFLAYAPDISLITGLAHDHFEIYPSLESYNQAFVKFINQSQQVFIWQEDLDRLPKKQLESAISALKTPSLSLKLPGRVNRLDGELAARAVHLISKHPLKELYRLLNKFPGVKRRFEQIAPNLYSDYAHTPEKIAGCLDIARHQGRPIVVVYEPHSNDRQHQIKQHYQHLFDGVKKLYWLPSFSAREKDGQTILSPEDLIGHMSQPAIAEAAETDDSLVKNINRHLKDGDLVVAMSAGSLDSWLRDNFGS